MIIVGADGLAGALTDQARLLGYAVTVCDPRPVFATRERFPAAEVVRAWPDRYLADEAAAGRCDDRTVVCVLTHDVRVDVPVIMVALGLPELAFVGATGSRAHLQRPRTAPACRGLHARGPHSLADATGLDLGGRQPAEAAVSIPAEILAERQLAAACASTRPSARCTVRPTRSQPAAPALARAPLGVRPAEQLGVGVAEVAGDVLPRPDRYLPRGVLGRDLELGDDQPRVGVGELVDDPAGPRISQLVTGLGDREPSVIMASSARASSTGISYSYSGRPIRPACP